ncbi:MAG: AsmA-like C-terminal region-containing protein [Pseudorhodoplanes sp.]|uniref:AsmA family protein n=1 Tax=Pseudorhodoplanes sp. TaxID=1934341 RepID=UPI003D0F1028
MQATLLTLAIAAILALLAALVGPHFVDWNAHRAAFEQQASQVIGLPVRVTGPMDVRLLPSPSLVLSGVEIGHPGDAQALRAKALGIEFALPPLLSGKLRAVELRLIAPEMRVSLTQDGRALLPNALAGVNTEALSIDKFVVEDASLQLADAASGASATLSKLWFNGDVKSLPGPIRGEGAFVMDGVLYGYRVATARPEANGSRIKLTIDPADRPVYAEAEGLLSAGADGAPRFEGTATVARRAPAAGETAAPWRISARLKANAASALFEQVEYQYGPDDRALKLHGTAEARFGARPRIDAVLTARTLDADKLLGDAGGERLPPRDALVALIAAVERIVGPPIPTQVGFGVDALTLGGTSLQNIRGDIEFSRGSMTLSAFELRAPGFTQLRASGRLDKTDGRLSFAGPLDIASTDPSAFADWLEGAPGTSALPARPVQVRGDVMLGAGRIAIARMQASFDRKSFHGDLAYRFAQGTVPARLDASLRADELDLDALMEAAESVKLLSAVAPPEDLALVLALGRVRFAGLDGDRADLKLGLKDGVLSIERFAIADLAGLAFDGKGRMDMPALRGSMSFNLAMRDPQGLSDLAKLAPAVLVENLKRAARNAAPARLAGTATVEPSGPGGDSRATVSIEGPIGAMDFKLKTALTGRWSEPATADIALEGSLDAADVNALLKVAGAERVVSVPRQPGSYTLSLNGSPAGDMRLDTRIVSANLDTRATGSIRPFAKDGRRASLDIAVGSLDIVLAGEPARTVPLAIKTRLLADGASVRLEDLSASVAGSALRGRLGLTFGDAPAVEGEVRTDTVDITAVFATLAGFAPSAREERRWRETPFALPAFPKMTGSLTFSAAQAILSPTLLVSKFRSVLRFADMNVAVEGVEGELLGGHLSGHGTLRRGDDGLGLAGQVNIVGADATQLLFGDGAGPLTGQAGLTLRFEGQGRSPRALIGSLNGSGTLTLDHARIAALAPNVFSAAMLSVDQGLSIDAARVREVAGRALDAGPLAVPHAEATLTLAAGVVRINTFKAQAEAADLAVTGSYDFSDSRIDARLSMSGSDAGASLQPEIAVVLRGPASAPDRMLDVSALTGWLALRSVDRQTKKLEAIEQGAPAVAPPHPVQEETEPEKPQTHAVPRRKPPQPVQALPPAVEIRPAAGDRRRAAPPPQQRAEPSRAEPQRPLGANPFPQPIGRAPPPPVVQPRSPQRLHPIF